MGLKDELKVDAEANKAGLMIYFPWGQIIFICIVMAIGSFGLYMEFKTRLGSLETTVSTNLVTLNANLNQLTNSMDTLSSELKTIQEVYNRLDTRVTVLEKESEYSRRTKN